MEAGHENSSKRRDRLMHVFMKKSLYHLSSLTTPLEIHTELSHLPETSGQQHIITPAQTLHSSDIVHQSYFMTRLKAYFDAADSKTKSDLQSIYFAKMQSMTQSEKSNSPPSTRKSSTYIEIATYMALWVKDKKLPKAFDVDDLYIFLEKLILYGFSRDEVELIFLTAGYENSKVQTILDSYNKLKAEWPIETAMSVFISHMDLPSLHTLSRAILDVRAANVVVSREILKRLKQSPGYDPSSIPHDWEYLLTQWINHFYTRERVHLILRQSDLKPRNLQQVLGYYDQIKSTLQ